VRYFFDEAGSFAIPIDKTQRRAAVVVGVAVPDHVYPELRKRYLDFASTLEPDERVNGEPKGSRLCYKHRMAFGDVIRRMQGDIAITPVTLDLAALGPNNTNFAELTAKKSVAWLDKMETPQAREDLLLLGRQLRNLSDEQALRLYCLAHCMWKSLHHTLMFLSFGEYEQSWHDIHFIVDRVQTKPNAREEVVFNQILKGWFMAWGRTNPLWLLDEIHTKNHVVVQKYVIGPKALNAGPLLDNRVHWLDSRDDVGLQIADMAAAVITGALRDVWSPRTLTPFAKVMRGSFYGYKCGPGLFTLSGDDGEAVVNAYWPLCEAMRIDQSRQPWWQLVHGDKKD
jgi:Protein of unknown function (DUF3800)